MTPETHQTLKQQQLCEDRKMLDQLAHNWLRWKVLSILETDPFEKMYARRIAETAWETLKHHEGKMVRRFCNG